MAKHSTITGSTSRDPAILAQRADALHVAGESIACVADLVSSYLSGLQKAVREHGTSAADLGDWHIAQILLNLAIEQATIVTDATA